MNQKSLLIIVFASFVALASCGKNIKKNQSPEEIKAVEDFADEELTGEEVIDSKEELSCGKVKSYKSIEPALSCAKTTMQYELIRYNQAITNLGGSIEAFHEYKFTQQSYNQFLKDSGVKYFTASEFIFPGNIKKAKFCDAKNLIPPKPCWYRSLNLLLLADKIRRSVGRPFFVSSLHRSKCYNTKIGGAKKSDHLISSAMDLSFDNHSRTREKVQTYIYNNIWDSDLLGIGSEIKMENGDSNIAFGLGRNLIHISLNSPHGRRVWNYSDFKEDKHYPNRCWE